MVQETQSPSIPLAQMAESAHDVHNQASARTCGVDWIGQAAKVDFACAELGDERN